MMQDQSVGHVFASNHNYFLLPSVSLCSIGYSKATCVEFCVERVSVCISVYQCVFGGICVAELLMQCKSNLPHGRCNVRCLLCVRVVFLYVHKRVCIVREQEGAVL